MTLLAITLGLLAGVGWALYVVHWKRYKTHKELLAERELEIKHLKGDVIVKTRALEKAIREHREIDRWWSAVNEDARKQAISMASTHQVLAAIEAKTKERANKQ